MNEIRQYMYNKINIVVNQQQQLIQTNSLIESKEVLVTQLQSETRKKRQINVHAQ